jgi:hypothetical protein
LILALFALGVVLVALPGLVTGPPRRFPLREWVPVATVSMAVGVLAIEVSLVLAAVPSVAFLVGAPGVVDACRDALAPLTTDPGFVSWVALVAAGLTARRIGSGVWQARTRARRAQVEPWLGAHSERDGFELVVLPTPELVAFGVSASPPQVVISDGLIEELEPAHVEAVIGHEAAHHRLRHASYLALLGGAASAFGRARFVNRSLDAIRDGLEGWADDEVGAAGEGSRRALREALVGVAAARDPAAGTWARIGDRMRRLDRRVRPRSVLVRGVLYAPVVVLGLSAVILVAGWLTEAHHAVAFGAPCMH